MALKTYIKDGAGNGRAAKVTQRNALLVTNTLPDLPPAGTPNVRRYYNALLGSTGANSGITNMNVDGSVTSQDFYIESFVDYDVHIMGIGIVIADGNVSHNTFGAIAALTNGWELFVNEAGVRTDIISSAKTGGQVIVQSGLFNAYGDASKSFELTGFTGNSDATTVYIPVSEFLPDGIRIGRDSLDRIVSRVNDDLTGLVSFNVRIFGYSQHEL